MSAQTKTCPKCNTIKDVETEFGYRIKPLTGDKYPQSWCRDCRIPTLPGQKDLIPIPKQLKLTGTIPFTGPIPAPAKLRVCTPPKEGKITHITHTTKGGEVTETLEEYNARPKGARVVTVGGLKELYADVYPNDKTKRSQNRMVEKLERKLGEEISVVKSSDKGG